MAPDGRELKAGLIGCGGRGTGEAFNFIVAGSGLKVTMLADIFEDKLTACRQELAKAGHTLEDANCVVGFDVYKKIIDFDVDVVLLCTPPIFRPEHFKYAVEWGEW